MSNPNQRRNAPRRQVRSGSSMHPGWTCFLAAFGSGFFTVITMFAGIRWLQGWDRAGMFIVVGSITIALFIIGGKKAEKLWDRIP